MTTYQVRLANPNSKWPYRIIRTVTPSNGKSVSHKLSIKFESSEKAHTYLLKYGSALDRCC